MYLKSIKTKVRGIKRKIRLIDKWKMKYINLDIESLLLNGRDYLKIWISPFNDLYFVSDFECGHKNPPNWYNRLIFDAIIDIYKSWNEKLKKLNQPYYLKIWLYDPRFIESQLVVAVGDFLEFYDSAFSMEGDAASFPKDKYLLRNNSTSEFDWVHGKDELVILESEHMDDIKYLNRLRKMAYKTEQKELNGQHETLFYIRKGDVWVGTLKAGLNVL